MFSGADYKYTIIIDDQLYAPREQAYTLLHKKGAVQADGSSVCESARTSQSVDTQLRLVAKEFLVAFNDRLWKKIRLCLSKSPYKVPDSVVKEYFRPVVAHSTYGNVPESMHHIVDNVQGLRREQQAPQSDDSSDSVVIEEIYDDEEESDAVDRNEDDEIVPALAAQQPHEPSGSLSPRVQATTSASAAASTDEITPAVETPASPQRETRSAGTVTGASTRKRSREQYEQDEIGVVSDSATVQESQTLSSSVSQQNALRIEFEKVAFVRDCSFRDLPQQYSEVTGKPLEALAQLVCMDPPYNTRSEQELPNSEYDVLSEQDMDDALEISVKALRPGGHILIFSASQQSQRWICKLNAIGGLSVDRVPLYIINSRNNLSQPPFRLGNKYINMVTEVVHAAKTGRGQSAYNQVQYQNFGHVPSSFPPNQNVIDNVPKMPPGEKMMNKDGSALRPEQKPLSMLKELIERHSLPGATVIDLFGGTYSTGVACLELATPRLFIGCELDSDCHSKAENRLFKTFANGIVSDRFPLLAQEQELLGQAQIEIQRSTRRPKKSRSLQPDDWPVFCILPSHLTRFICIYTQNMHLYDTVCKIPVDKWPAALRSSYLAIDSDALLAQDCSFHKVYVAKSKIVGAKLGVFAACAILKGTAIGWYNGVFVHRNIGRRVKGGMTDNSLYGRDGLSCTIRRFKDYAMRLPNKSEDEELFPDTRITTEPFVVPPPYCVASYINDKKKLNNGLESENEHHRKANVQFVQKNQPFAFKYLIDPYYVTVQACVDIAKGEEILVNYGSSYW
jgi:hypothetical protein